MYKYRAILQGILSIPQNLKALLILLEEEICLKDIPSWNFTRKSPFSIRRAVLSHDGLKIILTTRAPTALTSSRIFLYNARAISSTLSVVCCSCFKLQMKTGKSNSTAKEIHIIFTHVSMCITVWSENQF